MKNFKHLLHKAEAALAGGQYTKAINSANKLLAIEPLSVDGLMLLGEAYLRNEQFFEALSPCAKAVELDNKNIRAINNFGAALIRNMKNSEAREIFEYGLEIAPENIDLYINLGNVYQALGQPEAALKTAMKAIEINPSSFMAFNNLGTALGDLLHIEEARQAYITANTLNPNYLPTVINLAQLETKIGNHKRGIALYESILRDYSQVTEAYANMIKYYLSYSYLYLGDLEKGWDNYEYGFSKLLPNGALRSLRKFNKPRWSGQLDEASSVLIWREQGLGDEIVFGTCLTDLDSLGIKIILECDPRLVGIYQRTFPNFVVRPECFDANYFPNSDDYEAQCPIGSLPKFFRRKIEDFNRVHKTWIPNSEKLEFIKTKLTPYRDKILVGVSWRSGKLSVERNNFYTSLLDWKELLANKNLQFVSLQYGDCEAEIKEAEFLFGCKILRWDEIDLRNDLEAVLAICSQMDYIVSVGTALAEIAAASGAPTLLLLVKSWILLGQEGYYPWSSNVRTFVAQPGEHVGVYINHLIPYLVKK